MRVIRAEITKSGHGTYSRQFYRNDWQDAVRSWTKKCVSNRTGWTLKLYRSIEDGDVFVFVGTEPSLAIDVNV